MRTCSLTVECLECKGPCDVVMRKPSFVGSTMTKFKCSKCGCRMLAKYRRQPGSTVEQGKVTLDGFITVIENGIYLKEKAPKKGPFKNPFDKGI